MNLTADNKYFFTKDAKMKKHPIFINEGRSEMVEGLRSSGLWMRALFAVPALMLPVGRPDLATSACSVEDPPRKNPPSSNPHSGCWSDTSDYLVRKYSMENAMNYVAATLTLSMTFATV